MISSALFIGKPLQHSSPAIRKASALIFALLVFGMLSYSPRAFAIHEYFTSPHLARTAGYTAGALAGLYFISELSEGPIVMSALYTSSSIYLMNTWFKSDSELEELVIPFGMLTMGIVNAVLLNDEAYTNEDVLYYNVGGVALLTAYAVWEHQTRSHPSNYVIVPRIQKESTGFVLSAHF